MVVLATDHSVVSGRWVRRQKPPWAHLEGREEVEGEGGAGAEEGAGRPVQACSPVLVKAGSGVWHTEHDVTRHSQQLHYENVPERRDLVPGNSGESLDVK